MNHCDIKIALLDMNNNHKNQGMRNIIELAEHFKDASPFNIQVEYFDVRHKGQVPKVVDFDIFISSGGPGNPHREGHKWEDDFGNLLDEIWETNKTQSQKKYLFLICHSFQMAVIHWKLANVCERKSYSFGVMPIHKEGTKNHQDILLKNLPEPFYGVDSRAYQCIEPDYKRLDDLGMKIVAIEKDRPHISLERAMMAIRFSKEIFGTQFHPEADPDGFLENLKDESNVEAMIDTFGEAKYLETISRMNDDNKIVLTRAQIIPKFLKYAAEEITKEIMIN